MVLAGMEPEDKQAEGMGFYEEGELWNLWGWRRHAGGCGRVALDPVAPQNGWPLPQTPRSLTCRSTSSVFDV